MTAPAGLQLPNWLDAAALSHPMKRALSFANNHWTYADLHRSTSLAAAILADARGQEAGRIGILSANRPGFVFAVHAATRIAAPIVPLNWRQTSEEIAWQLRNSTVRVLVVDDERVDLASRACAGLPITIVAMKDLERASVLPKSLNGEEPRIDLGQEAAVIYTSGTSGRPKGARISYGNLWFSAIGSALHLGHRSDDVWLAAMPLFHVGGLSILFRAVIGALPVVLQKRFDPESMISAIAEGATLVSVVPFMLQRMLEVHGDARWPASLRRVLVGGSSTPPSLIEECLRLGIPVAPTYGLTEATSQATTLLPEEAVSKPFSSGLPLPLTEVRIIASSGAASPGESGSIEIRGPTLFAGYLGDEDRSAGITADGWFQTGDVGYMDDEGFLYVVDRRDDLIISGGENVYPAEIERVLRGHPSVVDAGVIGVKDGDWGSRPVAAVVWRGDPETAAANLLRHCEERLAGYKIPDHILLLPELPRSTSGKLLRRELRAQIASIEEMSATGN
ncbi:MAG: o-succinylbenzoate--CoA ligase [Chloroflexi bacterium]|nr:o-succinylbenzoate--CoA ligase [Chloroflexota bacterium]